MSTPRTYTITLAVPNRKLWGNGRTRNQRYKRALVTEHRQRAAWAAIGHDIHPPMLLARAQLRFHFARHARRDAQNLIHGVKAYIDGLEDAGIIANDFGIRWHEEIEQLHDAPMRGMETVEITLTEIGGDE